MLAIQRCLKLARMLDEPTARHAPARPVVASEGRRERRGVGAWRAKSLPEAG